MAYDIKVDGVTQSLLTAFMRCPRLAAYMMHGYRRAEEKPAAQFGSLVHWLLEHKYRTGKTPDPAKYFSRDALREESTHDAIANAGALLIEYERYYKVKDKKLNFINLESTFDVQWRGYRLRGQRDGVFTFGPKQSLWLLETKTKAQIAEDTLTGYLGFDFQNLFYILASSTQYKKPVRGVLYNVIRVPQLKRGERSVIDHRLRVQSDIAERRDHYFKRFEVAYTNADMTRFMQELEVVLVAFTGFAQQVAKDGPFIPRAYRNSSVCQMRWNCEFMSACSSSRLSTRDYVEQPLFSELKPQPKAKGKTNKCR